MLVVKVTPIELIMINLNYTVMCIFQKKEGDITAFPCSFVCVHFNILECVVNNIILARNCVLNNYMISRSWIFNTHSPVIKSDHNQRNILIIHT